MFIFILEKRNKIVRKSKIHTLLLSRLPCHLLVHWLIFEVQLLSLPHRHGAFLSNVHANLSKSYVYLSTSFQPRNHFKMGNLDSFTYVLVNIYFSPSKLYGSSKARFFVKNQLQSYEITKFCVSIR